MCIYFTTRAMNEPRGSRADASAFVGGQVCFMLARHIMSEWSMQRRLYCVGLDVTGSNEGRCLYGVLQSH